MTTQPIHRDINAVVSVRKFTHHQTSMSHPNPTSMRYVSSRSDVRSRDQRSAWHDSFFIGFEEAQEGRSAEAWLRRRGVRTAGTAHPGPDLNHCRIIPLYWLARSSVVLSVYGTSHPSLANRFLNQTEEQLTIACNAA